MTGGDGGERGRGMLGVSHLLGEVEDWPVIPGMFGNMQLGVAMVQAMVWLAFRLVEVMSTCLLNLSSC